MTTYGRTKEEIDGKVEMETKKEAVTKFALSKTTNFLKTEIPVKRVILLKNIKGFLKIYY